jgi:predicted  nucleic acid-binding Zn-ribbon protein
MTKIQRLELSLGNLKNAYNKLEEKQDYLKKTFNEKFDLSLENYGLKKENEQLQKYIDTLELKIDEYRIQIDVFEETLEKARQEANSEGHEESKFHVDSLLSTFDKRAPFCRFKSPDFLLGFKSALDALSEEQEIDHILI